MADAWPFGPLKHFSYDVIMADPPWLFKNYSAKGATKNASAHYDCVTLEDIKALPVSLLARDRCVLFLWVTNPLLREGFEVLDAWNFRYAGIITWNKKTINEKDVFGTGYNLRGSTEHMLLGFVGSPQTVNTQRTGFEAIASKEHSQKPAAAMEIAERYLILPEKPYRLELFSRLSRQGWDSAGNEAGKFDATAPKDWPLGGPDDQVAKIDFWPHLKKRKKQQQTDQKKEKAA